jgi:hypothetical protein
MGSRLRAAVLAGGSGRDWTFVYVRLPRIDNVGYGARSFP